MRNLTWNAVRPITAFCYVWLTLGFFLGTAVLLGPARWLTTMLRDGGWQQRTEDMAMMAVMMTFVVGSAALAVWIVRMMGRCQRRSVRMAVPTLLTIAAAGCLWGWTNPAKLLGAAPAASSRVDVASGAEFVFGPYPDRPRLEQLKKEGFTAVISLQHPAVVPFEPAGIAAESSAAGELGLTFIHAPMLPWVSSNDASLNTIRELARTTSGRYYVHCGLGRDRVNLVKRMLELEGKRVVRGEGYLEARTLKMRVAENRPPFERGRIQEVESDLWLLPYPNKHEFFGNMLAGQVRHVTLVLDRNDPEQRVWIEEATRILTQYSIPFDLRPLPAGDAGGAADIVRAARQAPRPEAVIVPYTEPSPATGVAGALLSAFQSTPQ